ncbi:hypothetical protein, partial [Dubosiella newyorkensis]
DWIHTQANTNSIEIGITDSTNQEETTINLWKKEGKSYGAWKNSGTNDTSKYTAPTLQIAKEENGERKTILFTQVEDGYVVDLIENEQAPEELFTQTIASLFAPALINDGQKYTLDPSYSIQKQDDRYTIQSEDTQTWTYQINTKSETIQTKRPTGEKIETQLEANKAPSQTTKKQIETLLEDPSLQEGSMIQFGS